MSEIKNLRNLALLGTLIFIVIGITVAFVIGRAVAKPLAEMIPVLEAVSRETLREGFK